MRTIWKEVKEKFKKVDKADYIFKMLLKTPERIISGIVAGLIVWVLIAIL